MVTWEADSVDIKEDIKKKPGPNNPEEATRSVQEVDRQCTSIRTIFHPKFIFRLHQEILRPTV